MKNYLVGISTSKSIKYLPKLISPLMFLIYCLVYFLPRNRRSWVFGSGVGVNFSDNAKYLFLYCSSEKDINCYWITKNKDLVESLRNDGLNAYYKYSAKGLWLSLSSKVYVYDSRTGSINHWASAGAIKVNLWHGSPLKTIDRDITVKHNAFYIGNHTWGIKRYLVRMIMPEWFVVADLMIATSEKVKGYFNSAFGSKKIEVTGYPRNDIISNPSLYARYLVFEQNIIDSISTEKTILYAPTFRDTNRFNREAPIEWGRLNDLLRKNDATFLIKLHRHDYSMAIKEEYSNIRVLDNESDMYPLFSKVDLLITDYSSIFFDFLLTDKPVLFYPYDKEDYLTKDRSMYDEYDTVTPGHKAYDFNGFYEKLELFFKHPDALKESVLDYQVIKKMYNQYSDSDGAKRTYQFIALNI
ncbi:MAG: Teichoic acid poly(glycerol phosphate) polymerase [Cryomorphaceae bacterium]|nr:MAG: Teichoic acid poly(glycerol phosphate) polymerase [Cryomorphaceae bacterium]